MRIDVRLGALLASPDPAQQLQGVELVRSLGDALIEALAAGCVREPSGLLWHPDGLTGALLEALGEAVAPVRGVYLTGPVSPQHLAHLPDLERLHITDARLPDFALLQSMSRLRVLTLRRCELGDLSGLMAMPSLRELTIENCRVLPNPLLAPGLPSLTALSLDEVRFLKCPLPDSLRHLNITGFSQRLDISGLPLEGLSGELRLIEQLSDPGALTELTLQTGDSALAQGLPLTGLCLSSLGEEAVTLGAAGPHPRLSCLDLGHTTLSDPEVLDDLPALEVIQSPSRHLRELPAGVVVDPWRLRIMHYDLPEVRFTDPSLQARSEAYWHARGHRYRLHIPPNKSYIQLIKALRRATRLGLKASLVGVKLAMTPAGLCCLSLHEALWLQGALLSSGSPATVTPYSLPPR